jgi:hypothetical protein
MKNRRGGTPQTETISHEKLKEFFKTLLYDDEVPQAATYQR